MNQADNKVFIEGILSEIGLNYGSFMKNGTQVKSVGGEIKIKVTQEINKESKHLEIPVRMFASELTNKGTKNPAYESIERVMNEYKSIAAVGEDEADRVRISSGKIRMNEYWGKNGQLISYPTVNASFMNKVKKDEFNQKAVFEIQLVVDSKINEVDREGVETGRLKITGVVPQWGDTVDVVPFYAETPNVINAISNYWNKNDTVNASGKLNFTAQSETVYEEVGFGDPIEKKRTINISDLVITGGSESPAEGDFAFNMNEINDALIRRQTELEAKKNKDMSRSKTKSTPTQTGLGSDLGF